MAIYIQLYSTLLNFQIKKIFEIWVIHVGEEACCPFYASLLYKNVSRKGFDPELYESKFI